ncbi:MAG: alanine--glyoxylate aminotransferase family protein [Methanothrix sp.]|nr:alanine--glyoxylate aminotransferase family protein [Methanothrix sp.]OPX82318.1 MAG: phosphoserine aminotransferase [Methanosaeta sp. PtaB.Bin087]OPY56278.1 MAG: phosphoserine aminotransferase [Methanosaeta sp. PtaU1.Bin055]NLX38453.1 alanine--glyoxylate aminotransferase family protein [Methanothrix sp.]HNR56951.1 alanine--glyoxylate aminotransferase family protein [Methanothrix sp.]
MDIEDTLLMIPGPVKVPQRVLRAMSKPMISHRSADFEKIYEDCRLRLRDLFDTKNEVVVLSGSGTAGMEAAVGGIIGKGEKVVTITNGKFGERFTELGDRYGTSVPLDFPWGTPFDLERVKAALEEGAKAITMVHNETSVGIVNPAKEVGKLARKYDAVFIVDGISSVGGNEFLTDEWGVDIAITGSQKCLAVPPGLAMVAVSERAMDLLEEGKGGYYTDLKAHLKKAKKNQTPYTPAVSLFFALQEALTIASEEGFPERRARMAGLAGGVRAAASSLGIELFPQVNEHTTYSNTVTAMKMPNGINDSQLRGGMRKRGVVVSGGQEGLKGKIFRIGTMGACTEADVLRTISTLELVLKKEGVISSLGAGIEAASRAIDA